jgi:uncharacterized protein YeeX (DUF496 family)
MVDSVDFVSIESGLTASQFNAGTRKFYGMNTGGSAATTSGAISKVASLVRSGVFRVTLKGTENNYDAMVIRIAGATGCAEQVIAWSNVDNDDSDIMSALTVIQSMASDAASAAQQVNSRVLVAQSFLSDIRSHVSDLQSDFQSRVPKAVATNSQLSDLHSDLKSYLGVMSGIQSDLYSQVSDFRSDLNSFLTTTGVQLNASTLSDIRSAITAGPAGVLTVSDISDIGSRVALVLASDLSDILSGVRQTASRALVVQSQASDVYSMLSDLQSDFQSRVPKRVATDSQLSDVSSDLASKIAAMTATVSASDMSDIASRVDVLLASRLSDILSAAQQTNSRVLIVQSQVSDTYSQLSDFRSDLVSLVTTTGVQLNNSSLSDIRSAVTGITATLTVSDISDIASRVQAVLASDLSDILSAAQQGNSRVLVVQSMASDAHSAATAAVAGISDAQSDLRSLIIAGAGLTLSAISDIASAVRVTVASDLSDILSAAQQANSRILVVQSMASDVYSQLSDFRSDVVSVLTTTGVQINASSLSDLRSAITGVTVTVSASDISDIASAVRAGLVSDLSDILSAAQQANSRILVTQSMVSDVRSHVSDLQSDFQSRVPKLVATNSQLSDLASDLKSSIGNVSVALTASDISDIASAVAAAVTTVTASDISDIASRVDAVLASRLSDILSAAQQANSRVLLVQSQSSDVYSLLSDLNSNFNSRVPLEPASRSQLSDLASDVKSAVAGLASMASDAASAAQQANSRVLVVQSQTSDIYSLLSDVQSDFQSRVPKRVATDSQLSALASDVISALAAGVPVSASDMSDLRSAIAAGTLTASAISDIASAVAVQLASDLSDTLSGVRQANSRLLVAQSTQSDIYSLLSDLHSDVGVLSGVVSDLDSALDAGVEIGPSSLSDLRSMVLANGVLKPGAEPTGVPAHTATFGEKMDWVAALARNKVKTTSTLMSLRDDADATTIASATVADSGGSFVRGEWSS